MGYKRYLYSLYDSDPFAEFLPVFGNIYAMNWPVRTISFSHDSKYLALGSEDHFIEIVKIMLHYHLFV